MVRHPRPIWYNTVMTSENTIYFRDGYGNPISAWAGSTMTCLVKANESYQRVFVKVTSVGSDTFCEAIEANYHPELDMWLVDVPHTVMPVGGRAKYLVEGRGMADELKTLGAGELRIRTAMP